MSVVSVIVGAVCLLVIIPAGLASIWVSKGSLLASAASYRQSAIVFDTCGHPEKAQHCRDEADKVTRAAWPRKPKKTTQ